MQFIDQNLLQAIEEGRFTFAYGVSPSIFLFIVAVLIAIVWFTYRKTTRPVSAGWKAFFIGLRSSVLVILLFCLLRPVITTTQVTPQETYPFKVFRSRHRAAAELESEGLFSGEDADCQSRKQSPES